MDDYRRTKYCPELDNVRKKKEHIKNKIKEEHPRAQDMHTYISNNSGSLKKEFMKIYNDKCAYCGVSNDLLPKNYFEVDHFLYEKAPLFKSKKDAGYIENLVLACHDCNHIKSSFYINSEQYKNLHPDQEGIKKTFVRDKKYYIRVNDDFVHNEDINKFYNQLQLGSELHRLDYLLMNIIGMKRAYIDDKNLYSGLGKIEDILRRKRNIM